MDWGLTGNPLGKDLMGHPGVWTSEDSLFENLMRRPLSKDITGILGQGPLKDLWRTSGGSLPETLTGHPLSKDLMGHPWAGTTGGSLCEDPGTTWGSLCEDPGTSRGSLHNDLLGHHWMGALWGSLRIYLPS